MSELEQSEETLADELTEQGVADFATGLDDLEMAAEAEDISKAAIAAGASDMTRGVDEMIVADRLSQLSDIVGAAGITDVAEGLEMLEVSEDVELMGAMGIREVRRLRGEVGRSMSFEDLEKEHFGPIFGERKVPGLG